MHSRLALALACSIALAGSITLAIGSSASVDAGSGFLTLPFASTAGMHIQRGWFAMGGAVRHRAIDYIRGVVDATSTWKHFPVVAAAPAVAGCAQLAGKRGCVDIPNERRTNRVLLRHEMGGAVWYTVYEDLQTISPVIPVSSRPRPLRLGRGAAVGVAGEDPSLVHLHFVVLDARLRPVDPYGIQGSRSQYPDPSDPKAHLGRAKSLWQDDPPRPPTTATPVASPSHAPTAAAASSSSSSATSPTPSAARESPAAVPRSAAPAATDSPAATAAIASPNVIVPFLVASVIAVTGAGLAVAVARRSRPGP